MSHQTRQKLLTEQLKNDAFRGLTRWLATHRPDEPPLSREEIVVAQIGASWGAGINRSSLEDVGAGEPACCAVEALLILVGWLDDQAEVPEPPEPCDWPSTCHDELEAIERERAAPRSTR